MDNFEIPLTYNGNDYLLPATLLTYGYSYKIEVDIFDTLVSFETDEEWNYRAVINVEDVQLPGRFTKELLQLIAEKLQELFDNNG